jgi:NAD(P)-dependent dehydrogenase (short-subunit alcohol dehydrogenase family)
MDSYYTGRVAVVTGAGSGIGRALAVRLARVGAALALLDVDGPAVDDTARRCQAAGARARAGQSGGKFGGWLRGNHARRGRSR